MEKSFALYMFLVATLVAFTIFPTLRAKRLGIRISVRNYLFAAASLMTWASAEYGLLVGVRSPVFIILTATSVALITAYGVYIFRSRTAKGAGGKA